MIGHLSYILGVMVFASLLPDAIWEPGTVEYLFIVGMIGIWRYSWGALHIVRSIIYRAWVFPEWRRAINRLGDDVMPDHVMLLVTSFRQDSETTRRVYDSVFREAVSCGLRTTVIASIVEMADQRLIKELWNVYEGNTLVKLKFVRIPGTGKRDALAVGFRSIAAENPGPNDVAAVIDGDSMLEPGLIRKTAGFFAFDPKCGALTTDEFCEVEGRWIFKEWYNMRFAQRHILMSSVGLSRKVLTLTGRMSMFRAHIVADREFIERVQHDWINHWRLGRFDFLTGDDKSSWFHVLSKGWDMLYIPDVRVVTIETPPDDRFLSSAWQLMRRWFGNMLRTNSRAVALGPGRIGWFPWICVVDQRISMWTSLTGPAITLLVSVFVTPYMVLSYMLWVLLTRYALTLALLTARPNVSAMYPFLLYFNQVFGSMVKIYVVYHLDKQKWTRQSTTISRGLTSWKQRSLTWSSNISMTSGILIFMTSLAFLSGVLEAWQ